MNHQLSPPPSIDGRLYAPSPKIHPRRTTGTMRRRKTLLTAALLSLTALAPWLRWDRGADLPDQAVLFSFTQMRAYCFGLEVWAQEFYLLVGALIVAALGLFLVTAMYGRVWCGFACPQTVWTDIFVAVERLTEGDRNQRIKLDQAPWSLAKAGRKLVKHLAWLTISALTAATFVFYFTDAVQAARDLVTGQASALLYGFWAGFAARTYLMAGWARDQACTYMCPWPRIQGGMLDEETRMIGYDQSRGEPRGPAKTGKTDRQHSHCIDCTLCAQVCPVGIDIRDGMQMECIACGLCADACNGVMKRLDLPLNLVGWSGSRRILRPRTLIYAGLIAATLVITGWGYGHQDQVTLSVLPDRSPSTVRLADGSSRNGYTVHVLNRLHRPVTAALSVSGLDQAQIQIVGQPQPILAAGADRVETFRVLVRQPPQPGQQGANRIIFALQPDGTSSPARSASVFIK